MRIGCMLLLPGSNSLSRDKCLHVRSIHTYALRLPGGQPEKPLPRYVRGQLCQKERA